MRARNGRPLRLVVVAALLAPAAAGIAAAAGEGPLTGHYRLDGQTLVDSPTDEPRDTHLYLELTDDAAKALYDAMKTRAVADACGGAGSTLKRAGGLQCSRSAGGMAHRCWFGLDLRTQKVVNGIAC